MIVMFNKQESIAQLWKGVSVYRNAYARVILSKYTAV